MLILSQITRLAGTTREHVAMSDTNKERTDMMMRSAIQAILTTAALAFLSGCVSHNLQQTAKCSGDRIESKMAEGGNGHLYKAEAVTNRITWTATTAITQVQICESKATFTEKGGPQIVFENWASLPKDTVLSDKIINGIQYGSTASQKLVVGKSHGGGWLLGYRSANDRYSSFSDETISFHFANGITSFGISFSQGNQTQGVRGTGKTSWLVDVDGTQYPVQVSLGKNDRSGEAFLGLVGLNGARSITVKRTETSVNTVWNIRDIGFSYAK